MEIKLPLMSSLLILLSLCFSSMAELPNSDKKTYIVHMTKSEVLSEFQHHTHWYDSLLKSVSSSAQMLYTYEHAIHSYSTRLTESEAESLKSQPGILAVLPELCYKLHTTCTPEFLELDRNADLFPESHSVGDIIIGILDTGVLPEALGLKYILPVRM